ncbi:hypothetical protein JYU34_017115 [Plutella xylostella]|uniref:Secreted protein n=1 Tax=Plutella xylostella TaxID=51655 RepID=A0ABQ7Q0F0_PLUXY|nr:hypothetical protein JYU34_017115 [Plutella xylostella]
MMMMTVLAIVQAVPLSIKSLPRQGAFGSGNQNRSARCAQRCRWDNTAARAGVHGWVYAAMQVPQTGGQGQDRVYSRQGRSAWLGLCSDAGTTNRWPGPGPGVRCDAGGTRRRPAQEHRAGCMLRCRCHETAASAGAQGRVQVTRNFNFTESACLPSAGRYRRITLLAAHATMSQHTETRSHVLPVKNPMTVLESSCL